MNDGLMETLLHAGESSSLDYKRDQYPFAGATDEEKSELIKDILALANAWKQGDAHILVGVQEVVGSRSVVVGVNQHIAEADLQQFVNSKTNRPVLFAYRAYSYEGKQVGVITVHQQDRPFYLAKNYGKLQKHFVYYRQGTSTAIATPDDIARMGAPIEVKRFLDEQSERAKTERVRVKLGLSTQDGFHADIYNSGEVTVHIKEVSLCGELKPDTVMSIPLLCALAMPTTGGDGSVCYVVPGNKDYDLAVRKEVRYLLPRFPSQVMQQFTTGSPQAVWLAVASYGGEIHRVEGMDLQPVLVEAIKLWQAIEEAAKPRAIQVVFYSNESVGMLKEVGTVKAVLVRPNGKGPLEVRLEQPTGLAISREECSQLVRELAGNKVTGRLGQFEWRVE